MPNTAIIIWFKNSRSVHLEKYETLAKMTLFDLSETLLKVLNSYEQVLLSEKYSVFFEI